MIPLIQAILFQIGITVNSTQPCFLNYTAGADIWENCGAGKDWLTFITLPFDYITGGNFTMSIISVIILAAYIKYKKVVYPIIIGVFALPVNFYFFPLPFINFAIIFTILAIGLLIAYIYVSQTNEQ